MGLSVKKLLDDYFYKEEIQDALDSISEPVSGSKDELIRRLQDNWESHNHDIYELLCFIDKKTLMDICNDYNLDTTRVNVEALRRRIKKANLLGSGKKPIAHVDTSYDFLLPKNKLKTDTSYGSMIPKNKQNVTDKKSPKISDFIKNHLVGFIFTVVGGLTVAVITGYFLK